MQIILSAVALTGFKKGVALAAAKGQNFFSHPRETASPPPLIEITLTVNNLHTLVTKCHGILLKILIMINIISPRPLCTPLFV